MEGLSEEVAHVDSLEETEEVVSEGERAPLTTCIITPSPKEADLEDPRPKPLQQSNSDNSKGGSEAHNENGKKKPKDDKPPSKVVVRRLPPSMTKDTFLQQVSPLPPVDYIYFVAADTSMGPHAFSRVYLNFVNQDDLFAFTQTFDNYVFLDAKGLEYPAIVEFAPFQRVPRVRVNKKKDPLMGTLDSDPVFVAFKENILAEAIENSKPGAKTVKQHYFETEINTTEEISTTPLLEFLKQKRAEKARIKEERREEKRKKEAERKLKQKAKEKKTEGAVEEEEKEVKILSSKDKESKGGTFKRKDREDRPPKENRGREFKNRNGGKSYLEERQKQAERREEGKKKISNANKDEGVAATCEGAATIEEGGERPAKSNVDRKKGGDNFKKVKSEEAEAKKRSRQERAQSRREARSLKRLEEFVHRKKGLDKKQGELPDKKKPKGERVGQEGEVGERRRRMSGEEEAKESGKRRNSMEAGRVSAKEDSDVKRCSSLGRDEHNDEESRQKGEGGDHGDKGSSHSHKREAKGGKDPRTERRIRNKDRPSLEIYRPGMGKFSKQRLEKEKTLGSSTEVDSPSHSPSPPARLTSEPPPPPLTTVVHDNPPDTPLPNGTE